MEALCYHSSRASRGSDVRTRGEEHTADERGRRRAGAERRGETDGGSPDTEQRDDDREGEPRDETLEREHRRTEPRVDEPVHVDVQQRLPEAVEHAAAQD